MVFPSAFPWLFRSKSGVSHTETGPLAELLAIGNLDERDLVLIAKGDDQLLVGLLLAVLVQNAHVGLATVESLGSLSETASETVVHEGELENTLEGVQDGHLALGGISGNFNLLGDLGGVVLFYVRLQFRKKSCLVSTALPRFLLFMEGEEFSQNRQRYSARGSFFRAFAFARRGKEDKSIMPALAIPGVWASNSPS